MGSRLTPGTCRAPASTHTRAAPAPHPARPRAPITPRRPRPCPPSRPSPPLARRLGSRPACHMDGQEPRGRGGGVRVRSARWRGRRGFAGACGGQEARGHETGVARHDRDVAWRAVARFARQLADHRPTGYHVAPVG
ncbi:hypothetical protein GUJ93_ZPchr0007g3648 [Zizania palustris]|uniref:Uncharacterized protein n=1 Tax=Zizania palustris TaxID=103762 RepID=A0A8J5ST80_ZIZPA|nr:hypothetical protein GUJ93_ZPchr0007g3648 [Zizania palustris]